MREAPGRGREVSTGRQGRKDRREVRGSGEREENSLASGRMREISIVERENSPTDVKQTGGDIVPYHRILSPPVRITIRW